MTYQSVPSAPVRRMSASSLASLIFGILGCIPFVTGALAILLGIVGLIRTGNPLRTGRWMAVTGLILGLISVSAWAISGGAIASAVYATYKGITAPAEATHDFIQALSEGNMASARLHSSGLDDDALKKMSAEMHARGTFINSTMNNINWVNGKVTISGTAQFSAGTQEVSAHLEQVDGKWKVTHLTITGPTTAGPAAGPIEQL